jgi:hypothetical protein
MTQSLDLNKLGLSPMTEFEVAQTNGGALTNSILISIPGVAGAVVSAVSDFARGFWDGLTS